MNVRMAVVSFTFLQDMFAYLVFYVFVMSVAHIQDTCMFGIIGLRYVFVENTVHGNDTVFVGVSWRRGILVSVGSCSLRFTSAATLAFSA